MISKYIDFPSEIKNISYLPYHLFNHPHKISLSKEMNLIDNNIPKYSLQSNSKSYLRSFSLTLDQLLSPLMANSSNDPIDQIWGDKLKIARFKISSLTSALSLRETIKDRNIYGIDKDICKIHTLQFTLASSPSFDKYSINPDQIGLEKTVSSLEHEKRSEVANFWKDITSMRNDFVEAITEYLSLKRKMALLGIDTKRYSDV